MTHKFKVGDKVRVRDTPNVRSFSGAYYSIGKVFTLNNDDVRSMNDIYNNLVLLNNNRFSCNYVREDFELVEQECEPSGITINSVSLKRGGIYKMGLDVGFIGEIGGYKFYQNKEEKSIMSKISSYVKNLTLSAEEKLLRKYGLKNECGEVTGEGINAINEKFYNSPENVAYLVSIAQGLEEESNKK